jgi:hypothetical protein
MVTQVGYSVARRSLCAICTMHRAGAAWHAVSWLSLKTKVVGLVSKPLGRFVSGLASKPLGRFLVVWPQNRQLQFGDLGLKIIMTVSWFVPQNQSGFGLSVAPQNR